MKVILIVLPGIEAVPAYSNSDRSNYALNPANSADFITLPENTIVEKLCLKNEEFNYIKLHGSYNWKFSDKPHAMVIGTDKKEQIDKIPLLKKYSEIFENALSQKDTSLLVIGYGFGDKNINEIISKSVKNFELKIYVISPEKINDFNTKMCLPSPFIDEKKAIYNGLAGYYMNTLVNIFPSNGDKTSYYKNIKESLFPHL